MAKKINWTPVIVGVGLAGVAGGILWYTLKKGEKVYPTDDAYVSYQNLTTNYNTPQLIEEINGLTEVKGPFLKFTVPPLAIKSAKLKLYVESVNVQERTIELGNYENTWAENTLTFGNQPTYIGDFWVQKIVTPSDAGRYIEIDITSYAQAHAGAPITLGISGITDDAISIFSSKEGAKKPYLEITKY